MDSFTICRGLKNSVNFSLSVRSFGRHFRNDTVVAALEKNLSIGIRLEAIVKPVLIIAVCKQGFILSHSNNILFRNGTHCPMTTLY